MHIKITDIMNSHSQSLFRQATYRVSNQAFLKYGCAIWGRVWGHLKDLKGATYDK